MINMAGFSLVIYIYVSIPIFYLYVHSPLFHYSFFYSVAMYYQQLFANKMDNLEEMDKLLEKYNIPKLNQREKENMNRPITSMEIKTVIKNLPTNKSPGPDGFTGKFCQKFTEELTSMLLSSSK